MKIYSLQQIVDIARSDSPWFKKLYKDVPKEVKDVSELPLTDLDEYWTANTINNNEIVTNNNYHGHIFKSGGTSGNPKFSIFSNEEWKTFCGVFGESIGNKLVFNEKIANVFYCGDLYCSFLFIRDSLAMSGVPIAQFPISGATDEDLILKTINDFQISTIVGVPTTIIGILNYYKNNKDLFPQINVKKILFGGEPFFDDQRKGLDSIFPGIEIVCLINHDE